MSATASRVAGALSLPLLVFTGAFLLFGLEPLVGRMLLPLYGGAFHVWTTALMFFQAALLVAYLYAHFVAPRIGAFHLAVLLVPLAFLPPGVGGEGAPGEGTLALLVRLVVHIGLPFVALATTAVVAQNWRAQRGGSPWSLYAFSNAGSLLALLLYVLVIEPLLGLEAQRWAFTGGYALYLVFAFAAAFATRPTARWREARPGDGVARREVDADPRARARVAPSTLALWTVLAAGPSAFSMAVTNVLALDAGSVPLVWVLPLAIYLGSYVIAFAEPGATRESRVPRAVRRFWPHVAAGGTLIFAGGAGGALEALIHLTVLGFVCAAAHAELYRRRPEKTELTTYYLTIALGGALGGAFVALGAPALFTGLGEYPASLVAIAAAMATSRWEALGRLFTRMNLALRLVLAFALTAAIGVVVFLPFGVEANDEVLETRRSFYGVYRVVRRPSPSGAARLDLVSGGTRHGRQREGDGTPLSYYHPAGPLGDAVRAARAGAEGPLHLGVVGLGVGAAAGHLEAGESARFFEIDPVVAELARAHFDYLEGGHGETEVVIGDARLALSRDESPPYHLLLVDAFSGDAIPTHLSTREAIELYLERLAPGGLLVLHLSNRFYDLRPVMRTLAAELGLPGAHIERLSGLATDEDPSRYVVLAREARPLEPLLRGRWRRLAASPELRGGPRFTDDHAPALSTLVLF